MKYTIHFHLVCLFIGSSFLSFGQDFDIQQYDVKINVYENGSFQVEELIDIKIKDRIRGIFRTIPIYRDLNGKKQNLQIDNISVKGKKSKTTLNSEDIEIGIGEPNIYLKGRQTYNISYTVNNGITPYERYDELTWPLTGTRWETRINEVSFKITLPKPVDLKDDDIRAFTGDNESNDQHVSLTHTDLIIEGKSLVTLGQGKGMTVAFKVPKGYYEGIDYGSIFSKKEQAVLKAKKPWRDYTFPLPLILGGLLVFFYQKNGRTQDEESELYEEYFPPQGLTPPQIGVFHDNKVNHRDVVSLIPYWGEQGYLSISPSAESLTLHKKSDLPYGSVDYERTLFNKIFESGDVIDLDDLENELYSSFHSVGLSVKKSVLQEALYDQDARKTFQGMWMLAAVFIFIVLGITSMSMLFFVTGILFFISAIVALVIYTREPKHNDRGRSLHHHLASLRQTLESPDPDRLSQIIKEHPRFLEQIFPYVVAFGLDDRWAEQVSSIFKKAPDWYYDNDADVVPTFTSFNQGFRVNRINDVMISRPAPVADPSSGSFGGGGSVGGGFSGSGGGGGSW